MVRIEEPEYSDGLLRILIEPLSNMIDNLWRSREAGIKCTKFGLGVTKNSIEFWNDGLGIPVEMDGAHGVYIPELIFGHLLTSSNYDDTEDRFASGRNGIGVKLSNVFSKQFEVEIGDSERGLVYLQKWSDHMRTTHKPKITTKKSLKNSCRGTAS
jgi:DNA topoisomerase-2